MLRASGPQQNEVLLVTAERKIVSSARSSRKSPKARGSREPSAAVRGKTASTRSTAAPKTQSPARRAAAKLRARKARPAAFAADQRFVALLEAFARDPQLAPISAAFRAAQNARKRFGSNGLKVNDKLFALWVRGSLVVKLPAEHAARLVAAHQAMPFEPRPGRAMKSWLVITSETLPWVELAEAAYRYVRG
jgi:hypothetical protein